jgi:hypothetical protein
MEDTMAKNLKRVMILTASLITLGTAAYGQEKVVADVKFPFSTSGGAMPAGTYSVQKASSGGSAIVMLRNEQTRQAAILITNRLSSYESGNPKMIFRCGNSGCSLATITLGNGSGWEFRRPRLARAEKEILATVNMRPSQGQ